MPKTKIGEHPAKFSDVVLDVAEGPLLAYAKSVQRRVKVLDPFAGVGKCFLLQDRHPDAFDFTGIELEPDWNGMDPRVTVGNALDLTRRYPLGAFDACFTSPSYGNRMADHHDAKERCKACGGEGRVPLPDKAAWLEAMKHDRLAGGMVKDGVSTYFGGCTKCDGKGYREYVRNTYKHRLGHDLHEDNSGAMQWGQEYRDFHAAVWQQVTQVVRDLFVLNISDHIRKDAVMPVAAWHCDTLVGLGWTLTEEHAVATPRNRYGQNGQARVENEWVYVFRY